MPLPLSPLPKTYCIVEQKYVVIIVIMLTANQMPGFTAANGDNNVVVGHGVVERYIGLWNNGHKLM